METKVPAANFAEAKKIMSQCDKAGVTVNSI